MKKQTQQFILSKPLKFIISLFIPLLAGYAGSLFTSKNIDTWYTYLNKPSFTPPNWVFSPVWTLLFILMSIAFYIIWIKYDERKTNGRNTSDPSIAMKLYFVQLGLNILWSIIFFGMRDPRSAFIVIFFLLVVLLVTVGKFYDVSKKTIFILLPYLIWIFFALLLNVHIVILN